MLAQRFGEKTTGRQSDAPRFAFSSNSGNLSGRGTRIELGGRDKDGLEDSRRGRDFSLSRN